MSQASQLKPVKLTRAEQRIENALARGEFEPVGNLGATKKLFEQAAKNYQEMRKSKRITIRVNQEDLIRVKAKADRNNVPYQTLLNVLIRQYARGLTQLEL